MIKNQYFKYYKLTLKKIADIYARHEKGINLFSLFFYRLLLDITCYFVYILSDYAFLRENFSVLRYSISIFTLLIFSRHIILLYYRSSPSSIIITIFNMVYFIPMTTMYAFYGFTADFYISVIVYWAVLLFFQHKIPVLYFRQSRFKYKKIIYGGIVAIFSITILYVWCVYTDFRVFVDIYNVYSIRGISSGYDLPQIVKYILLTSGILIPLYISYSLDNKKLLLTVFLVFIWLINFSISANKITFFILFVCLIGFLLYKKEYLKFFIPALSILVFFSLLAFYIFDFEYLISHTVRRMMLLVNRISYDYYLFFSENVLNIFRDGILNNFGFNSVYSSNIPAVIGTYTRDFANLNNGLLGDVFANLGYPGLLIMPLVLVIILRLIDSVTKDIDARIYVSLCVYSSINFMNTTWSAVLVSHGYILACLLLYFYPNKKGGEIKNDI